MRTAAATCLCGFIMMCSGVSGLYAGAPGIDLANALAEEGDWDACRQESIRAGFFPETADAARRLRAQAERELAGAGYETLRGWRRVGALPVKCMVGFYRLVVAPALGSRCVLEPSCSRYSMQAARERGWLGLPMTADRLIREPSIVMARRNPVKHADGRLHFDDPVSDHIGGIRKMAGNTKKAGR